MREEGMLRVLGTGCLERYLGLRWRRYIRDWKRLHNEYLCHVLLNKYFSGHEIKKNKQAEHVSRVTYGAEERGKTCWKQTTGKT
jgi:hypothetical protein